MVSSQKLYLSRYAYQGPLIEKAPVSGLGMVIVIPCYDEPCILQTLESLLQCSLPLFPVEVIIVVNHPENCPEDAKDRNRNSMELIRTWAVAHSSNRLAFYPVWQGDLPAKHAGVGLARKIGMDEAVWRFHKSGLDSGIIVNLDADCTCHRNYLTALGELATHHPGLSGCNIYFEHPIDDLEEPLRSYIIDYELHLRYHVGSLHYVGYPYPFHTVGSSMAVSLKAYISQGGMNRRKAGEDFYFLHKIFPLGNFYRLNSTVVYPAARYSLKVPFGTGAALWKMNNKNKSAPFRTYNWQSYINLGAFLQMSDKLFHWTIEEIRTNSKDLPECMGTYLSEIGFLKNVEAIKASSTSLSTFRKAFFRWFDGLKMLQYLNYAGKHYAPDQNINEAASILALRLSPKMPHPQSNEQLLICLREWERSLSP